MLRWRHILLASATLLGCSPAPTGDGRWLTQPTRDQHAALFFPVASGPHAVECNSCHGVSETFRDFDCLTCHPAPATTPRHSKVGGFAYTSASCYGCHPDGLAKGVAAVDHTPLFPIAPGDAHAIGASSVHLAGTIQCTSCHTSTADRKQVDCTVCHASSSMLPLHVAVADLPASYASPDTATFATTALCLRCHADSRVPVSISSGHTPPAPAHTPFLVGAGAPHYQKDCLGCHLASRTDKPWAADFAQPTRCTGCHTDPKTTTNHLGSSWPGYPGTYRYDDAACISCHPAGDMGPFVHANFPTAATDVHDSSVAGCTNCHTNSSTPTDVTTISCIGCHDNSASSVDPGGVDSKHTTPAAGANLIGFGYTFDSSTPAATVATNGQCLKCHAGTIVTPSWTNPLKLPLAQHNSLCFRVTSGDHRVNQVRAGTPACFVCHNSMNTASKPWGVNWALAQCTPCHNNRTATCR